MKVIAIFSGKGGVGKSTISALFAMALAEKKKVALLDMDINTPSIPVMFGRKEKIGKLKLFSSGFNTKDTIGLTGRMVRSALDDLAKKVLEYNPDICIIDMPPGTNDIHLKVCKNMNPSSFVLVMQPNKLCEEDAIRAGQLFMKTGVPIAGVIQNMVGEVFGEKDKTSILGLPVLASIPLNKEMSHRGNSGKMGFIKDNPLKDVANKILKKSINVTWHLSSVNDWEGPNEDTVMKGLYDPSNPETHKYYGLATWDKIRGKIIEYQWMAGMVDKRLEICDADTIRRVVKNLSSDNSGMFMVTRVVNTTIKLFPGEIGMGRLLLGEKLYYGLPRILYETDKGDVHLFPDEIKPVTNDELSQYIKDGEHVRATNSTASRFLPKPEVLVGIGNTFGMRVDNWEKEYEELGISPKIKKVIKKRLKVGENDKR